MVLILQIRGILNYKEHLWPSQYKIFKVLPKSQNLNFRGQNNEIRITYAFIELVLAVRVMKICFETVMHEETYGNMES